MRNIVHQIWLGAAMLAAESASAAVDGFEERSGKVVLQVAMQEQDATGSWEVA